MNIDLFLPFPPTINNYYVKTSRGMFISQKGRLFRDTTQAEVLKQLGDFEPITDRIHVSVVLYPPDKRKRDLDNYMKPLLDALTHSQLWIDDSIIDQLHIFRGETVTKPKSGIRLEINLAAPILPLGLKEIP